MDSNLPKPVRDKLSALIQSADENHASMLRLTDVINGMNSQLGRLYSSTDVEKEIADLQTELTDLRNRQARHQNRSRVDRATAQRCQQFVSSLSPTDKANLQSVTIRLKLAKQESASDALSRVRSEITGLQTELHKARYAPLSASDLTTAVRAYVQQQGRALTAKFDGLDGNVPFKLSSFNKDASVQNWLAFVVPDHLADAILQTIPTGGLAADDKASRIAELELSLLASERIEEALLVTCESVGQEMLRRVDADPRAVLGIELLKQQKIAA